MATSGWTFEQLGNKGTKSLRLQGYNAPFGRPRKDPVLKETIKSRVQTTNYPGRSGRPTRHSFGINWEPMELKGRWMTKMMTGTDTANSVASDWTAFIKDEIQCRISWGNIVSYIGYIEELELARESSDQIAWKMRILVDTNDDSTTQDHNRKETPPSQASHLADFELYKRKLDFRLLSLGGIQVAMQDALLGLATALDGPLHTMQTLVGQIADLTDVRTNAGNLWSALEHLRSTISDIVDTHNQILVLITYQPIKNILYARDPVVDILWSQFQSDFEFLSIDFLASMAAMDRQAELAQREQFTKVIRANGVSFNLAGESWESLSIRATGSADGASRIRAANGGGLFAHTGETYIVP